MRAIENMSVLITGGGTGIGAGAAQHFAARGALVTISGRRSEPLLALTERIGDRCLAVVGDVTEIAEAFEYLARAEWTTGNVLTVDGGLGLGVTHT